jgi:HK97 family phage portal protein
MMFNNSKIKTLEANLKQTQKEYNDFIIKANNTFEQFDRMISREQGSTTTYSKLLEDYTKIGDAYYSNVFVRKCINKISEMISSVKVTFLDAKGNELADNNPIKQLFDYINEDDTPTDFFYEIVRSLQRFGKVFIRLSELKKGSLPVAMDVLPGDKVKAKLSDAGILLGWEYNHKFISKENIVFIRYKHPDNAYDGLSPQSAAIKEILQDFYAQAYQINYFKNGAMGAGYFYDPSGKPLTREQEQEAKFAIDQTFNRGIDNAGKSAVLKRKLEYTKTSDSAQDQQFTELLDQTRRAVYIAFDIPEVIFASANATYANLQEAKKYLWSQVLLPIIGLIEDTFNYVFFSKLQKSPIKIHFKIEDVFEMREDLNAKLASAQALVTLGVPLAVVNEMLELNIPDEGLITPVEPAAIDQTPNKGLTTKEIVEEYEKNKAINREKSISHDKELMKREYKSTLNKIIKGERAIKASAKNFFGAKYKQADERLKMYAGIIKADDKDSWIKSFTDWLDKQEWGREFFDSISSAEKEVFRAGARRSYAGIGMNFNQPAEQAVNFMAKKWPKLKDVPDNFIDQIKTTIKNEMAKDSWTIETMRQAISKTWHDASDTRARLVARTESTGAYNAGRVSGMKDVGIKNKQWINSGDDIVRDSHRIDDIVPVDEPFTLADGVKMDYPGSGDVAEDVCNCRCAVISVL